VLLKALHGEDPVAALHRQLEQADDLSAQERDWLWQLSGDGLIVTGLLLQKLRFERLTRADPELAALFAEQPRQFVQLFQAYQSAIPPRTYFPSQEAERFRRWQAEAEGTAPDR
jgi:hypothetical protein